MKKSSLVKLAMLGVSAALLASGCKRAEGENKSSDAGQFYEKLSPEAKKKFDSLDQEHKMRAMDVINQHGCKGNSDCSGHREQAVEEQYNDQMHHQ